MRRTFKTITVAFLILVLLGLAGFSTGGTATATGSFYVFKTQVVEDAQRHVIWARDANLAESQMTWDDALEYIATLNKQRFGGYSDWRMPQSDDLDRLAAAAGRAANVKTFSGENTIAAALMKMGFRKVQAADYWTSNYMFDESDAWYYSLSYGKKATGSKLHYRFLWPMRRQK